MCCKMDWNLWQKEGYEKQGANSHLDILGKIIMIITPKSNNDCVYGLFVVRLYFFLQRVYLGCVARVWRLQLERMLLLS